MQSAPISALTEKHAFVPKLIFVGNDGGVREVGAQIGETVMRSARADGVTPPASVEP
jgi:hypothetical protein